MLPQLIFLLAGSAIIVIIIIWYKPASLDATVQWHCFHTEKLTNYNHLFHFPHCKLFLQFSMEITVIKIPQTHHWLQTWSQRQNCVTNKTRIGPCFMFKIKRPPEQNILEGKAPDPLFLLFCSFYSFFLPVRAYKLKYRVYLTNHRKRRSRVSPKINMNQFKKCRIKQWYRLEANEKWYTISQSSAEMQITLPLIAHRQTAVWRGGITVEVMLKQSANDKVLGALI